MIEILKSIGCIRLAYRIQDMWSAGRCIEGQFVADCIERMDLSRRLSEQDLLPSLQDLQIVPAVLNAISPRMTPHTCSDMFQAVPGHVQTHTAAGDPAPSDSDDRSAQPISGLAVETSHASRPLPGHPALPPLLPARAVVRAAFARGGEDAAGPGPGRPSNHTGPAAAAAAATRGLAKGDEDAWSGRTTSSLHRKSTASPIPDLQAGPGPPRARPVAAAARSAVCEARAAAGACANPFVPCFFVGARAFDDPGGVGGESPVRRARITGPHSEWPQTPEAASGLLPAALPGPSET